MSRLEKNKLLWESRIKETRLSSDGFYAKINEFISPTNFSIIFEDNTTKNLKCWGDFDKNKFRKISNKDIANSKLFEKRMSSDGFFAIITKHIKNNIFEVTFEDGTQKEIIWDNFNKQKFSKFVFVDLWEKRIGTKRKSKDGFWGILISAKSQNELVVEYECGYKRTDITWNDFNLCRTPKFSDSFNRLKKIGEQRLSSDGFLGTLTKHINLQNYEISFADGYKRNINYTNFLNGFRKKSKIPLVDKIGAISTSTNCGDYELLSYKKGGVCTIKFLQTNNICDVTISGYLTGMIWDNSISKKISTSKGEKEVYEFIKSLLPENTEIIENCNQTIKPKHLDIYIPSLNLAFEYNGLYWHSSNFICDKNYHINKTNECASQDIKLIHIFSDEWNNKQEIVKSRIRNLLSKTLNFVYARKCVIKEVSLNDTKLFNEENHLQGHGMNTNINIGLYRENELVSLMSFRKYKDKIDGYELNRFSNKLNTNVIGGASKLLKYFEKKYKPKSLLTYAHRTWSTGNLYELLGFAFVELSNAGYGYCFQGEDYLHSRQKFMKHKLIEMGWYKEEDDLNLETRKTEERIMCEKGYFRVYDCGNLIYLKDYSLDTKDLNKYDPKKYFKSISKTDNKQIIIKIDDIFYSVNKSFYLTIKNKEKQEKISQIMNHIKTKILNSVIL